MTRAELRRVYREEARRNPSLTWTEYLHRLDVVSSARQAIIAGLEDE